MFALMQLTGWAAAVVMGWGVAAGKEGRAAEREGRAAVVGMVGAAAEGSQGTLRACQVAHKVSSMASLCLTLEQCGARGGTAHAPTKQHHGWQCGFEVCPPTPTLTPPPRVSIPPVASWKEDESQTVKLACGRLAKKVTWTSPSFCMRVGGHAGGQAVKAGTDGAERRAS